MVNKFNSIEVRKCTIESSEWLSCSLEISEKYLYFCIYKADWINDFANYDLYLNCNNTNEKTVPAYKSISEIKMYKGYFIMYSNYKYIKDIDLNLIFIRR